MKTIYTQNKKAFTIIDMLISTAILGFLATSVVINFNAGSRNDTVRLSADLVASTLRQAQTMTLTGAEIPDESLPPGQRFPSGGYGVFFDANDTNSIFLFADKSGNYDYDSLSDTILETYDLSREAVFSAGGSLAVVFSPPDADAYFNGMAAELLKSIV